MRIETEADEHDGIWPDFETDTVAGQHEQIQQTGDPKRKALVEKFAVVAVASSCFVIIASLLGFEKK
ncbi:MAG: hypothetical protein HC819_12120 [Cyclobacteriaceae bacterium]|nr:hypothetical protein [Cyclobacteriaceae bacterium]